MKFDSSRRRFLKAGVVLPAAGLVSASELNAFGMSQDTVSYRVLGKTGLKVSTVGSGVGIEPDPKVISRAIELGVNYFDTARGYGNGMSEKITGEALKGKRNRVILATKTDGRTKAEIFKDMDESLKALGTDYVDIYHLHSRDTPDAITDEAVEACETLKKQGKTRFIGVSTHDVNAVADTIIRINKFDAVQTTYSYAIGGAPLRQKAIARLY
ncbi:MAG: aldo/keto reductase, partial [Deltaproteobacteria bacterium]|nr:aldo/keto reductase [Deltaproteobacteria bacterium]